MSTTHTIPWKPFSDKHKRYIKAARSHRMCAAEGAIRSGKTIDHCIIAAAYLETCPDKIHLASGSTIPNAKLNIGDCNGFGLEHLFRGRCRWGKYKDNEALYLYTQTGEKVILFSGGGKADSYKRILGNSYGLWIATEINEHYDSDDSRESFIKVAMGRQAAAVEPFTLWDLNPCNPNHKIYKDYIDKYRDPALSEQMGGYLYEHFTMADNLSITEERRRAIEAGYGSKDSLWYQRDILGKRVVAEGLIYRKFSEHPERYIIDKPPKVLFSIIGGDFGGTGSAQAFNCTGYLPNMRGVVTLDEYYSKAELDANDLAENFVAFVKRQIDAKYNVKEIRLDSAETVLIRTLGNALKKAGIGIPVFNAIKGKIINRIRLYNLLIGTGRYSVMRHCDKTIDAFKFAMWNPKNIEYERLDDGTTNIDSLDAQEYSTEPHQRQLNDIIMLGGGSHGN